MTRLERLNQMQIMVYTSNKENEKLQDRVDELEQENGQLKGELEEYWYQDYIKEADADLLAYMRREMVWYV